MLGPGQAKLVKWKSSNDEDYNFVIPISAAAVSISGKLDTNLLREKP